MMALAVGATLFSSAFVPPQSLVSRREMVQGALSAAAVGFAAPAFADGATSKATLDRSRAIYGSRVARLATADAATILEEKNAMTLFISGAYRSAADKSTKAELAKLQKQALASAKAGDSSAAQAAVKQFVKLGNIEVLDTTEDAIFNPKQRRNAGAPPTSEIVAQMGTQSFALYQPLK